MDTMEDVKPLAPKEATLLSHLVKYREREGICPTTRELATMQGCSVSRVRQILRALEKKGYVKLRWYKPRAITIIHDAA